MSRKYASTIYGKKGSQGFWNLMDRNTDDHMSLIMKAVGEKVRKADHDFSRIFVNASNMYTFREENGMAMKGHNKKHRYDLNRSHFTLNQVKITYHCSGIHKPITCMISGHSRKR